MQSTIVNGIYMTTETVKGSNRTDYGFKHSEMPIEKNLQRVLGVSVNLTEMVERGVMSDEA